VFFPEIRSALSQRRTHQGKRRRRGKAAWASCPRLPYHGLEARATSGETAAAHGVAPSSSNEISFAQGIRRGKPRRLKRVSEPSARVVEYSLLFGTNGTIDMDSPISGVCEKMCEWVRVSRCGLASDASDAEEQRSRRSPARGRRPGDVEPRCRPAPASCCCRREDDGASGGGKIRWRVCGRVQRGANRGGSFFFGTERKA
jgi:hypothetical protein